MKKSTIAIALIIIFLLVVGSAVWLSLNKPSNTADTNNQPSTNTGAQTENTGSATDMTNKTAVDIVMRDMSFSPSYIKVKKGATVTWTNNDTVGHNVVASTPSSSGGLPTSHPLIGKGEAFSHTFNTVGTFAYYCTPHPFMKGTVEVVE